ncbi:MAG: class I SAM-dependent methyltransferase [Deltaproteobacteria bacterium]|nr:class I SAM-dependent methyltransferase [Deltaproteobacteria bacterium]
MEGIPCQDVERLTFPAGSFDLCTCTEVFEHVPDDGAGFREVCRVLASGGRFLFTVPLLDRHETVERARREGAGVVHLMDPEYHGDRIRGRGGVLAFRTYGRDILGRLARAGFASGEVVHVADPSGLSEGYPVVIGRKGGE